MISLLKILNELKINKPGIKNLFDFVEVYKVKIFEQIKEQVEDIDEQTGIIDINRSIVDEGYEPEGDYNSELVTISQNQGSLNNCNGLYISTLPPEWWDEGGSGYGFTLIEEIKFQNKNLYFDIIWC
jgi:hypothetical protein